MLKINYIIYLLFDSIMVTKIICISSYTFTIYYSYNKSCTIDFRICTSLTSNNCYISYITI